MWKLFGQRLDGFKNEDFAYESVPGDPNSMIFQGKPFKISDRYPGNRAQVNLAYTGSIMPPPNQTKRAPLSDEDRLTIVRWIDLGCPIDLDFNPAKPQKHGHGWLDDENRPMLALTYPRDSIRILVGMHDYDNGLDLNTLRVVSDAAINGVPAGQNLTANFKTKSPGVWEMKLPIH